MADPVHVLARVGAGQADLHRGRVLLGGRRARVVVVHERDDVPGQEPDEQEDRDGDREERGQQRDEALEEEAMHRGEL